MDEYWLQIVFKSNEQPWRNDRYDPYPRLGMNDEEAIEWARFFTEAMPEYQITLFKDGSVMDHEERTNGR